MTTVKRVSTPPTDRVQRTALADPQTPLDSIGSARPDPGILDVRALRARGTQYCVPPSTSAEVDEAAENHVWADQIEAFAGHQPPAVAAGLRQLVHNSRQMAELNVHAGHDELLATMAKIARVQANPDANERLDAHVGNFGEVVPDKLYRGAQPSPEGLQWLKAQGIKTIVLLREPGVEETNYPGYSRADYLRDIKDSGMNCVEIPMKDGTVPTPDQIQQFMATVDGGGQPVFVHCAAGVGRTGVMCGLYLKAHGTPVDVIIDISRRFQLTPELRPDHAAQANFIRTYPI